MKKLKSYTSIWAVDKIIYAIGNANLPIPVTITQIAWFVTAWFVTLMFGDLPPLSWIESTVIRCFAVPAGLAWVMTQKSFDGKKPLGFLRSACLYLVRPKTTYAGKAVRLQSYKFNEGITAVRSVTYVPD